LTSKFTAAGSDWERTKFCRWLDKVKVFFSGHIGMASLMAMVQGQRSFPSVIKLNDKDWRHC
jgi:hypothetical protein